MIYRAQVVLDCAIRLECNAMTYARSQDRYGLNVNTRLKAVRRLANGLVPKGEIEEEVVKEMRRVCSWLE